MSYKVLVVDDSKLARMAVAKALEALRPGWTRVEAANADEALALDEGSEARSRRAGFQHAGAGRSRSRGGVSQDATRPCPSP